MTPLPRYIKQVSPVIALLAVALCGSCEFTRKPPPPVQAPVVVASSGHKQKPAKPGKREPVPVTGSSAAPVYRANPAQQGQRVPPSSYGVSSSAYRPIASNPLGTSSRVLMIGDSLTVGPFGDRIEAWLLRNLGSNRVAVFGSCGSSPENWLASHKNFVSPCGYRETSPQRHILEEYRHGRRPSPVSTPKLDTLLARFRPQIVIVQLGTNHFDNLLRDGKGAVPQLSAVYEEFANAVHCVGGSVRMVIWITPPDSSKYPKCVEDEVDRLISSTNQRHGFFTFPSRRYTSYTAGVTGSDGVHYNDAGAALWAAPVIRMLDAAFDKYRVKN